MAGLLPILLAAFVLTFWILIFRYSHIFPRFSVMTGIFSICVGIFEASFYFMGSDTGESVIGAGLSLIFGTILLISGIISIVGARRTNAPTVKKTTILVWVAVILFLMIGMAQRILV